MGQRPRFLCQAIFPCRTEFGGRSRLRAVVAVAVGAAVTRRHTRCQVVSGPVDDHQVHLPI